MFAITAIVLSQLSTPLTPSAFAVDASAAPSVVSSISARERGSAAWEIVTPIGGGLMLGLSGFLLGSGVAPMRNGEGIWIATTLVGAAVGAGLGLLAGHYAREGSVIGRIASIAMMALGGSMATGATALFGVTGIAIASGANLLPSGYL